MRAHIQIVMLLKALPDLFLAQLSVIIAVKWLENGSNICLVFFVNQLWGNERQRRLLQHLPSLKPPHLLHHLSLNLLTNLHLTVHHPLVLQTLLSWWSLSRVYRQHARDQVFCFRGNVLPSRCLEPKLALFNPIEDILIRLTEKRRRPRQHHKSDHSNAPDVTLFIVILV